MAGIQELLALAEYDKMQNEQNNPLYALVNGISQGVSRSLAEQAEERKMRERTKTDFAKLQQLLNSESKDYQNNYKIKPSLTAKGEIAYSLAEKSDSDRFTQAVQSGAKANDLYRNFPQFSDKIDTLISANILDNPYMNQGAKIQAGRTAQQISASPNVQQPTRIQAGGVGELMPKGFDALGRPTGYEIAKPDKSQLEIEAGNRMANQSFGMVSGALNELAQTYADAVQEGGIGSKLKEKVSNARLWAGGEQAEKLSATSAFPGQKTEVIARMMPILTQQGDKPGSVRLVQTVFDKLEKTLPDSNTPPKNARRMMEQTLRNMYRFARASQVMTNEMGITDEAIDSYSPEQKQMLSNRLEQVANTISLTEEENNQIKAMTDTALAPIDRLTNEQTISKEDALAELRRRGVIK